MTENKVTPFIIAISMMLFFKASYSQSAGWDWERSAVRIDLYKDSNPDTSISRGSGFLYYDYENNTALTNTVILVTCRHVLQGFDSITISCLIQDLNSLEERFETFGYRIVKNKTPQWTSHEDSTIDVAVVRLSFPAKEGKKLRLQNATIAVSNICRSEDIDAGFEVLYVGFPTWPGLEKTPIVRQGLIALESSSVLGKKQILIEAFALWGNSGGPVFKKYNIETGSDSSGAYLTDETPCLIGIVAALDTISPQFYDAQGRRVNAMPWHSGLSRVFTFEAIQETIDLMNRNVH